MSCIARRANTLKVLGTVVINTLKALVHRPNIRSAESKHSENANSYSFYGKQSESTTDPIQFLRAESKHSESTTDSIREERLRTFSRQSQEKGYRQREERTRLVRSGSSSPHSPWIKRRSHWPSKYIRKQSFLTRKQVSTSKAIVPYRSTFESR